MIKKQASIAIRLFFILLFFSSIIVSGQDSGIKFDSTLSWKEIQNEAKEQNKYIFMDCFATWCGPCRFMSQKIFPQKEVGEYFNDHFISVKVQMDKAAKDPENVKQWYKDAKEIELKYSINTFPTYLFFSPDGQAVHRVVGETGKDPKDFIEKAKEALNPKRQYYRLIKNYKDHIGDSAFLHDALSTALNVKDHESVSAISGYYINCLKDPSKKENVILLRASVNSSKDKTFYFLLNNASKIDEILGHDKLIESELSNIIANEEIDPIFINEDTVLIWKEISVNINLKYPLLGERVLIFAEGRFRSRIQAEILKSIFNEGSSQVNWRSISQKCIRRFPHYDCSKIIAELMPLYYSKKNLWPECERSVLTLMERYIDQLDDRQINNIAWNYVFLHSDNKKLLYKAVEWSKKAIAMNPSAYGNVDTYANLLYKIGDRERAIFWEKRAIEKITLQGSLNDPGSLAEFKDNLEKMQKGETTW